MSWSPRRRKENACSGELVNKLNFYYMLLLFTAEVLYLGDSEPEAISSNEDEELTEDYNE